MNQLPDNNHLSQLGSAILSCAVLLLSLTACAHQTPTPDRKPQASNAITLGYQVQRGDSLVKIAKRLTGDSSNWDEIAAYNQITEPKSLQIGMMLEIPETLLPQLSLSNSKHPTVTESNDPQRAEAQAALPGQSVKRAPVGPIPDKTPNVKSQKISPTRLAENKPHRDADNMFQASSLPGELEVAAVVHQTSAKRQFDLEHTTHRAETGNVEIPRQIAMKKTNSGQQVRVRGTYYPKGIYSQPSYTSTLLMRTNPGSLFELEQSFGDWLQIRTDKGSGYIRASEVEIIGASAQSTLLFSNYV